jgi:hypothetical protein
LLVKRSIALRAHGIGEGGEPLVGPAVRGDDNRAGAIALEEDVVQVTALRRIEDIDGEVVEDQQVDRDQLPEFGFIAQRGERF